MLDLGWFSENKEGRKGWCGREDLNLHAFRAPDPKSGASANFATPASSNLTKIEDAHCIKKSSFARKMLRSNAYPDRSGVNGD